MAQFLEINECANLVETFTNEVGFISFNIRRLKKLQNRHVMRLLIFQGVSGEKFLRLEKADIMKLVNNKIGPCLKVENLLSLLKARMSPAHARLLSASRKTNP